MWELFLLVLAFAIGKAFGGMQAANIDVSEKISYMQDLLDQECERTNHMKSLWLDAEEKAETWERRYLSLVPEDRESTVGS